MPGLEPLAPQAVTVPAEEAVLIEFPALVEHPEAALACLGGHAAVASALASDSKATELALRFRCPTLDVGLR